MSKLTGKGLAEFARTKLGTPYVFGAKLLYGKLTKDHVNTMAKMYPSTFTKAYLNKSLSFVGKICTDCSGLISGYTGKNIGSAQMYSTAVRRGPISTVNDAPIGAALWFPGHIGVKVSQTKVIEAKGINYGTIESDINKGRWTHWLLLPGIEYGPVNAGNTVGKARNPYIVPTYTVFVNDKSEQVRWVQFELRQAGITHVTINGVSKELKIDGHFGDITFRAVKQFQKSAKLEADGKVGKLTRNALIAD